MLGLLPDGQAETIQCHLLECTRCVQTVRFLKADDPLSEAMRAEPDVEGCWANRIGRSLSWLLACSKMARPTLAATQAHPGGQNTSTCLEQSDPNDTLPPDAEVISAAGRGSFPATRCLVN